MEPLGIDIVAEEIAESWRGEECLSLTDEELGALEHVDEHLLISYGGLVKVNLPIHQTAGGEVVLERVDTFLLYDEAVVNHVEHLDDACRSDVALGNSCEERVASQVVETVHIELAGDELMQESLGVVVLEDSDGHSQPVVQVVIDALHHHQRNVLVRDAVNERILEDVRERSVPDVVHEDSRLHSLRLRVEDELSFLLQREDGLAHEVESTEGVLKTGVAGARIDDRSQPQLVDAVESLEQWMSYDVVEKSTWNLDESEYGIVDDFCFVHGLEESGVGM